MLLQRHRDLKDIDTHSPIWWNCSIIFQLFLDEMTLPLQKNTINKIWDNEIAELYKYVIKSRFLISFIIWNINNIHTNIYEWVFNLSISWIDKSFYFMQSNLILQMQVQKGNRYEEVKELTSIHLKLILVHRNICNMKWICKSTAFHISKLIVPFMGFVNLTLFKIFFLISTKNVSRILNVFIISMIVVYWENKWLFLIFIFISL